MRPPRDVQSGQMKKRIRGTEQAGERHVELPHLVSKVPWNHPPERRGAVEDAEEVRACWDVVLRREDLEEHEDVVRAAEDDARTDSEQ